MARVGPILWNAVSAAEPKHVADAAEPAVEQLIEEKYGQEASEVLDAMLATIKDSPYD